eukprot:971579-Amphidinium_carterae.1
MCYLSNDVPDHSHGGWLSLQLSHMRLCVLSFQARSASVQLLPTGRACQADLIRWPCPVLPPLLQLATPLLIPHHARVCQLVAEIVRQIHSYSGVMSKGLEIWRRVELGKPGTQMGLHGSLPTSSLLCLPMRRIMQKSKPPLWQARAIQARSFLRSLDGHPAMHVSVGGYSFGELIACEGVHCKKSLKRFLVSQRKLMLRCEWISKLNGQNERAGKHLCGDPLSVRASCARCGEVGRMRHTKTWYSAKCLSVLGSFDFDALQNHIGIQLAQLTQVVQCGRLIFNSRARAV